MKRIVFLHEPYFRNQGGAPLHLRRLAEELVHRDYDVTVAGAAPADPELVDRKSPQGAAVRTVDGTQSHLSWINQIRKLDKLPGGHRLHRGIRASGRLDILEKGSRAPALRDPSWYAAYDIVCLFNSAVSPWLFDVQKAFPRLTQVKVAFPLLHVREPIGQYPVLKKAHDGFDLIVTDTDFEGDWMKKHGWRSRCRFGGVGSDPFSQAVDTKAFREKYGLVEGEPTVLFLGRKVFNKGVVHVVQSMDTVWDARPETRLLLVGYAHNPRSWLEEYLGKSRHDAMSKTVIIDDAGSEEVEAALDVSHVMAAPSINDAFGIVYLDSWRHGLPVVGCRDTCCESFVEDGKNGFLVPFGDIAMLGERLASLVEDLKMAETMGQAGYNWWDTKGRWSHVADRVNAAFIELLETKNT